MWTAAIIFILVAVDASFLVAYITRFTEEAFATLISVIFIVESFMAMSKLKYPSGSDHTSGNGTAEVSGVLAWNVTQVRA